ncbi:MAG: hypothetical protein K2F63_05675 [Muribaculaceae bacterium]|nr:hypothetical protein [Muribaculaceae bacterium]MDE6134439.1 hypothetical protein [Muribaculaceae bacterium]
MKKNSTPSQTFRNCYLPDYETYLESAELLDPSAPAPRRSTVERIRQFARSSFADARVPGIAIVLN